MTPTLIPIVILMILIQTSNALIGVNYTSLKCMGTIDTDIMSDTNLQGLLSSLVSQISTSENGFAKFSNGNGSYALALCRGDIDSTECQDCVRSANIIITRQCPSYTQAVLWNWKCMIHYNNISFSSLLQVDDNDNVVFHNVNNVTGDVNTWIKMLRDTMNDVASMAATDKSGKKFATKQVFFPPMQKTLYTLAQCLPDLTVDDCTKCFSEANGHLPTDKIGGIVLLMTCTLRYEMFPFYQNSSSLQSQPPSLPPTQNTSPFKPNKGNSKPSRSFVMILGLAITVSLLIILVIVLMYLLCKKRPTENYTRRDIIRMSTRESRHISPITENGWCCQNGKDLRMVDSLSFNLATLQTATNNFSDDNKLGKGGYGFVYKGTLENGKEIAVKRLSQDSNQGTDEFRNEVQYIAKLQHKNLVRLLGYCEASNEKLLVYEFCVNKSLDDYFSDASKRGLLNWKTRNQIIKGIARGLQYLHEDSRLKIVHRDLKSSNVLLDDSMNPKISDFGIARKFTTNQQEAETKKVAGTFGYMAPEYVNFGQYSIKADVYSFGN